MPVISFKNFNIILALHLSFEVLEILLIYNSFILFQEVLCQTKLMCSIAHSAKPNCCCKLDIIFPFLSKEGLEPIITFLYSGKIFCEEQNDVSSILKNLIVETILPSAPGILLLLVDLGLLGSSCFAIFNNLNTFDYEMASNRSFL